MEHYRQLGMNVCLLTEHANVILKRLKGCGRSLCLDNYPSIGENCMEKDYLFDLMTAAKATRDLFCKSHEIAVESEYDTLMGCFTGENEKGYLLVNYTDPIRKCTSRIALAWESLSTRLVFEIATALLASQ